MRWNLLLIFSLFTSPLLFIGGAGAAPITLWNNVPTVAYITAKSWVFYATETDSDGCYITGGKISDASPSRQLVYGTTDSPFHCRYGGKFSFNEEDNLISFYAYDNDVPTDGYYPTCSGPLSVLAFISIDEDVSKWLGSRVASCAFDVVKPKEVQNTVGVLVELPTWFFPFIAFDAYCILVSGIFSKDPSNIKLAVMCTASETDTLPKYRAKPSTNPLPITGITGPGLRNNHFLMIFQDQSIKGLDVTQFQNGASYDSVNFIGVTGYNGGSTSTMRLIQSPNDPLTYLLISSITGVGFGTVSTYKNYAVSAYSDSQNYFFSPDFAPLLAGVVDSNTQVRFWISNRHQLLRDVNGTMSSFGNVDASLSNGFTIRGISYQSSSNGILLFTGTNTSLQYELIPVYACGNYTNCADCNINDPYYCGWNFNAVTCAQKVAGLVTNVRECPIITQIVPNVGAVGVSKTVVLSGSNLGLSTLSSYVPYCIITNSSTSIYVTGARLTDSSFSCPIPAQNQPNSVAVTLSLSTTGPNRPVYAKSANETANTFKFSFCSDYSTAPKCEAVLGELTDCGWCNSTSTCSPSTGCPASSFTRTLFPTVLEFSPNSLATGVESTFNIRGLNFVNLPSVNYTFHLFSASKRMEIPDDEPSNEEFSFEARVLSRNLIQSNVTVNSIGGFFAVLYSNKKLVDSSVNPIQTTNCTLLQSCGDCRRASVCNWCSDVCISRLLSSALLPCVQSNCQESLPSLSIVTGDVRENFDVDVNFWYSLDLNVNYTIDFGNNTEPIPLYFASGRTAIFSISSSQFTPGSYQPVIVGDNYVRNTSQTFVFTNCEGDNCKTSFTEDLGDTSDQTNPSSNTRPTDAIVQNSPSSQTNLVPVYIGASIGGFFLLLILVILIVILLRKKRDSFTDELIPPQDFEMVVVSKDAEQTFQVNKSHATILSGLETQLLRDGFPHAEEINDIVSTFDVNGFGKYYIYLAFSKDRFTARDLLQRYIRIEADATKVENEMFRNTSNGTQMFTAYAKVVGLEFLWNTLASPIHQIIKAGQQQGALDVQRVQSLGSNFDLDSDNQEDPEFVEANIYQLLSILSKIFARIRKNIFTLSPWIRLSIRDSRAYVSRRYPASDSKVVGSFLFLRYIVPAITSPQLYGITSEAPNEHAQRILILVSKVLQNLANETMPSAKMEGMQKMDQFVADNIPILHTMYDAVTNYHPSEEDLLNGGSALNLPDSCHENSIVWLHNFFSRNRSKLSAATLTDMGEFILPSEISKKNNKLE
eukprot:TRINITY_DN1411_c0_g1_i6.p1 TRINITY_DN1411_c0_g1~~TRINITY_DN1411_c0_g1_i6.p1  ORF type:complete len:1268 (-),score=349.97 TRINITY_DN1411_c0_g1_i6:141-3944(-)